MGAKEYHVDQMDQSKPGLLGLGFEVGESLPPEVATSEIPNKIGEKGEILWKVRDAFQLIFDRTDPVLTYTALKKDWLFLTISRAWGVFSSAMMGLSRQPSRDFVEEPPDIRWLDSLFQLPKEWEMAPMQIQELALKSAIKSANEFISNQQQRSQTA